MKTRGGSGEGIDRLGEGRPEKPRWRCLYLKRILAPTDLTPKSEKSVGYAIALAKHFGARLTLLNVYDVPAASDDAWLSGCLVDRYRQEAESALNTICEEIGREYPKTDCLLRCGYPAEEITAVADELGVDLIVISTHNANWLMRLVCGSDAEEVLRHAHCPVLIVRDVEHDFVGVSEQTPESEQGIRVLPEVSPGAA